MPGILSAHQLQVGDAREERLDAAAVREGDGHFLVVARQLRGYDDAVAEFNRYTDLDEPMTSEFRWSESGMGYAAYVWSIAADLWAARGGHDVAERIADVRAITSQHLWAEPCLLRAEGRLHGDEARLAQAAERFGAIGARFEQAVTEAMMSGRAADRGREALRQLGCTPEQRP